MVNIELGSHTATHIVVLHLTGATVHTRRLPSVNAKAWPGARDLEAGAARSGAVHSTIMLALHRLHRDVP